MFIPKNILHTTFNNFNENMIYKIIDILIKKKWIKFKIKINLCINLLGINILNILNINQDILYNIKKSNLYGKKEKYIKFGYPLLFNKIKIIEKQFSENIINFYKINIIKKNIKNNISVSLFKGGGVIWDNDNPRISMMYNL